MGRGDGAGEAEKLRGWAGGANQASGVPAPLPEPNPVPRSPLAGLSGDG